MFLDMCVLVAKLTLCDPMDYSPLGSSVHRIFQARILEWVAIPFSWGSSQPRDQTQVSCIADRLSHQGNASRAWKWKLLSCVTLYDPRDYTVHGILQARILEWVAVPFSRGSSQPRDRTQVSHIAGGFFTSWATREAHKRYNSPQMWMQVSLLFTLVVS